MAAKMRLIAPGAHGYPGTGPGRGTGPFTSFLSVPQNARVFRALTGASARCLATLRADLSDLGHQLVIKIVRGAGDHLITDQIERRSLQAELVGKVFALLERFRGRG